MQGRHMSQADTCSATAFPTLGQLAVWASSASHTPSSSLHYLPHCVTPDKSIVYDRFQRENKSRVPQILLSESH